MLPNKSLIQKADLALSELQSNGGALPEAKAKQFVEIMIKKGVLSSMARVVPMASYQQTIDKIRFASRIMRAGAAGVALSEADRSKPELSKVTLDAKLWKAEVQLDDEILEDNIEGEELQDHIVALVAERMGADTDDIVINSDSTDATLAPELRLFDGILKSVTTNTVAAGGTVLTKDVLKQTRKAMPIEFQQNPAEMKFMTSVNAVTEYGDGVADRMTGLGDAALQNAGQIRYMATEVMGIPYWPENLGGGSDETALVLTHPKNLLIGLWRKVRIEMERSARHGTNILVASVRMHFKFEHEPAVVKTTGIKVSA